MRCPSATAHMLQTTPVTQGDGPSQFSHQSGSRLHAWARQRVSFGAQRTLHGNRPRRPPSAARQNQTTKPNPTDTASNCSQVAASFLADCQLPSNCRQVTASKRLPASHRSGKKEKNVGLNTKSIDNPPIHNPPTTQKKLANVHPDKAKRCQPLKTLKPLNSQRCPQKEYHCISAAGMIEQKVMR